MNDVVHPRNVDRDDFAVAEQIEEMCDKQCRAAAVGAGLDEESRTDLANRFLQHPQVEDVLPDRPAQPSDMTEVLGLGNELLEKQLRHAGSQNALGYPCEHGRPVTWRVCTSP